jgi:hypothetical protein
MKGIFKYPKKSSDDNDKKCKDFLMTNYNCSDDDANKRTEAIKEICIDVMNKLLLTQLKIETRADLINLVKQYNTISNAKIIEYLEREFGKD